MTDPIKAAKSIFDQFLSKADPVVPSGQAQPSTASVRMARIGRKGGKVGGKRSLETMSHAARRKRAKKAAQARWKKPSRAK